MKITVYNIILLFFPTHTVRFFFIRWYFPSIKCTNVNYEQVEWNICLVCFDLTCMNFFWCEKKKSILLMKWKSSRNVVLKIFLNNLPWKLCFKDFIWTKRGWIHFYSESMKERNNLKEINYLLIVTSFGILKTMNSF